MPTPGDDHGDASGEIESGGPHLEPRRGGGEADAARGYAPPSQDKHQAWRAIYLDYLSTVSGGGFIGAWWSAWLSREQRPPRRIFPEDEELGAQRRVDTAVLLGARGQKSAQPMSPDGSLSARRGDPIHFVRLFSNYLTPKTGIMSPDTWRLIAYFVRSLLCTWAALLPLLFAVVLLAQSLYLVEPHTRQAFLCPQSQVASEGPASPAFDQEKPNTPACQDSTGVRLLFLKTPALMAAAVGATLILLWLIESASSPKLATFAALVLAGAGWLLLGSGSRQGPGMGRAVPAAAGAALLVYAVRFIVPRMRGGGHSVNASDHRREGDDSLDQTVRHEAQRRRRSTVSSRPSRLSAATHLRSVVRRKPVRELPSLGIRERSAGIRRFYVERGRLRKHCCVVRWVSAHVRLGENWMRWG
jgi:hypothetical protein